MVDAAKIPLYGVILAGGWGTRFWPLSRSQYPKQVLRLLGSESMLQTTVERLLPRIPAKRLAVVTNAGQAELIHQELHRQGWDEVRIWIEPEGKNTAAAVGLAGSLRASTLRSVWRCAWVFTNCDSWCACRPTRQSPKAWISSSARARPRRRARRSS